ncbi:peroxidase 40 [Neltuma alba]|uniref:peroxidase 40 n=1 Tax=Neltuma alba TaxID=207710 RepID=UPI0010A50769|nr:peroxidase 40 [Prosopis alba]
MEKQYLVLWIVILNLSCSALAGSTSRSKQGYGDNKCPLRKDVYQNSCPEAESIIFSWVKKAVFQDPRMAASLLRLHFHDCFVNGCDASVLLDDTEGFVGEKTAGPNLNSLRGFEVIDAIKSELETVCPQTVSCADILAIAARDSVVLSGGPSWEVQVGRRDSFSANKQAANNDIPAPNSTVEVLLAKFQNVGLSLRDMVALSGGHTIGKARCTTFSSRLQNSGSKSAHVNLDFISSLQQLCSSGGRNTNNGNTVAHLDLVSPATFDNQYYVNLLSGEGLLPSDQVLVTGNNDQTRQIVQTYAEDPYAFFEDFKNSMLRMGSIPGSLLGQIRRNCRSVN